MDTDEPITHHSPEVPRPVSIAAVLTYAGVLTGLVYLVLFNVAADAPMRHAGDPPHALKLRQAFLNQSDDDISTASGGQNVQLHIDASESDKVLNADAFVVRYFSAVYRMYPQRVYVGSDDQIINNAREMSAADQIPSVTWMQQHDVATIFPLLPIVRSNTIH